MITYVNSSNVQRYSKLFKKASDELHNPDNKRFLPEDFPEDLKTVNDIEEYFHVIEELTAINPVFTRLPLDEDVFDIDANTRVINIPNSFKTNGISVKGDEISEILYFKINRFFDATDLGWVKDDIHDPNRAVSEDRMNIVIQWETAPDANGNVQTGASAAWAIDIETDPDYVIFGWPIDSRLTSNSGTIKFSVRFFRYAHDASGQRTGYAYSFSTLTASVSVKPALSLDMVNTVSCASEINNLVLNRIKNGHIAGKVAEMPIFTFLSWINKGIPVKDESGATIGYSLDLVNGRLALKGQAFSPDAGIIGYEWHKGETKIDALELTQFEIATEEKFAANTLYYKAVEISGVVSYEQLDDIVEGDVIADYLSAHDLENVYKKYAYYEIVDDGTLMGNSVGRYTLIAKNILSKSTTEKESEFACFIPGPQEAVITTDLSPIGNTIKDDWVGLVVAANTDRGVVSCKWQVLDAAGSAWLDEPCTDWNYKPLTEGLYRAVITNTLNGAVIDKNSTGAKVTLPADAPTFTADYSEKSLESHPILSFTINPMQHSDGPQYCTYQWYADKAGTTEDLPIEGATSATYEPLQPGKYYCRVTNIYNLDRVSNDTEPFIITI